MKTVVGVALTLLIAGTAFGVQAEDSLYVSVDTTQKTFCGAPEARQFDFWIGTWNLTWGTGDDVGTGTNIITAELRDCMIEENFRSHDLDPFVGRSIAVWDKRSNQWKQTWADNRGAYLDFSGGWEKDRMILSREVINDTVRIIQRMVWYDIRKNSIEWKWENSNDGGQTWITLWQIHYQRKR